MKSNFNVPRNTVNIHSVLRTVTENIKPSFFPFF